MFEVISPRPELDHNGLFPVGCHFEGTLDLFFRNSDGSWRSYALRDAATDWGWGGLCIRMVRPLTPAAVEMLRLVTP